MEETPVAPPSTSPSGPPLASGNKNNRQPTARSSEEVGKWRQQYCHSWWTFRDCCLNVLLFKLLTLALFPHFQDPGWDVNSAFVANAVSHIRPKAKSKGAYKSKENKENESRNGEVSLSVYSVFYGAHNCWTWALGLWGININLYGAVTVDLYDTFYFFSW